jgi:hypothetical protein
MASDIKCGRCDSLVRLHALSDGGLSIGCDCDDASHSIDAMPYELETLLLPDDWYVCESYPTGGEREEWMRYS